MNKKLLIYLSPFSLLVFLLIGCGGPSASRTVEEFMTAMNYGDYERARELASSDSQKAIDWAESFGSLRENEKYENFEITGEEINGNYGKVYYVLDGETEEHFLKVKKTDEGDWVVLFSKADLGDGQDNDYDVEEPDFGNLFENNPLVKKKGKEKGALGSPDEVAEQFLMAMAYGDYEKAKGLVSEQSETALGMVKSGHPQGTGNEHFEITDVEKNGNYATVLYTEEGDGKEKELKLRKESSGKWVVIFAKSNVEEDHADLDFNMDMDMDWNVDVEINDEKVKTEGI